MVVRALMIPFVGVSTDKQLPEDCQFLLAPFATLFLNNYKDLQVKFTCFSVLPAWTM